MSESDEPVDDTPPSDLAGPDQMQYNGPTPEPGTLPEKIAGPGASVLPTRRAR